MKNRTIFIYSILLLIFITVATLFIISTYFNPKKRPITEKVKRIDYTYKKKFIGVIETSKKNPVYINSPAIIDEVFIEEGSLIKKGDILLSFTTNSSFPLESALKISELDIEEVLLKLETLEYGTSKLELDTKNLEIKNIADQIKAASRKIPILNSEAIALRQRATALSSLFELGGISAMESNRASTEASKKEDELEDMKMNLELLKQKYNLTFLGYESLKRDINMQKVQLSSTLSKLNITRDNLIKKKKELDTPLVSPVDGIVLKNNVFSGKNISPGDTLFVLSKKGDEIISFKAPLSEIDSINSSKKIEVSSPDSPDVSVVATIKRISNMALSSSNNGDNSINIELNLPPTNNFKLGYNVNISITGEMNKNIIVIKQEALFSENATPYIFIKNGKNIEKFRIQTGKKFGEYVEIMNLSEGVEYITNYIDFIQQ